MESLGQRIDGQATNLQDISSNITARLNQADQTAALANEAAKLAITEINQKIAKAAEAAAAANADLQTRIGLDRANPGGGHLSSDEEAQPNQGQGPPNQGQDP